MSYAIDDEVYQMNRHVLESLLASEPWQNDAIDIVLMESNKQSAYRYDDIFAGYEKQAQFRVEVPKEKFNFHRFFNIGLSQTSGEYVAFCNNDIVFEKGWFSEILKVKSLHPKFMCFSPIDPSYPMMASLSKDRDYHIGWENKKHFAAWCFVWERKVFDIIGTFDETFDFYSADDDELQTLRYHAISNVVVPSSIVYHKSQIVTKKVDESKSPIIPQEVREQYPLTKEELRRGYAWLWEDIRFYKAYQRFKNKWGNDRMLKRIHRLLEKYPSLNKSCITHVLYNKSINLFLAKLTGIKM